MIGNCFDFAGALINDKKEINRDHVHPLYFGQNNIELINIKTNEQKANKTNGKIEHKFSYGNKDLTIETIFEIRKNPSQLQGIQRKFGDPLHYSYYVVKQLVHFNNNVWLLDENYYFHNGKKYKERHNFCPENYNWLKSFERILYKY